MFSIFHLIILLIIFLQFPANENINLKENIIINLNQDNSYKHLRNLNSNNNKKNVIIGLIRGYSWQIIKRFFASYISAGFKNCDLVMFVDKVSIEALSKIKLCGTIIKDIPIKHIGFKDLMKYRWKWYSEFLEQNKDKYNMVFATDIRDIIFQKDIFQYYDNNKPFIGFILEDISLRNPVNKNWVIKFCKSREEYNLIRDKQVICGGTIISSVDIFIDFANILYETLSNYTEVYDQGAINYLIYSKKLFNDIMILSNNNGPVMTICVTKRKYIKLDSNDNILNFNGQIAAVVHQFDRKGDINLKFYKKYNDDIFKKYFSNEKINEFQNIIKKEEKAKAEYKIKIKIIKNVILFAFIIISISFICYIKAKKNGFCKKTQKIEKSRKVKLKKLTRKRDKLLYNINNTNHALNTSNGKINLNKDLYLKKLNIYN